MARHDRRVPPLIGNRPLAGVQPQAVGPTLPLSWIGAVALVAIIREDRPDVVIEVDARGLSCPLPLLKAKQALNAMQSGDELQVLATDPGSLRDFRVFAEQAGHLLLESSQHDGVYHYRLRKG